MKTMELGHPQTRLTYKHAILIKKVILTAAVGLLSLVFMIPFFWMISASLKLPSEVFAFPIKWIPDKLVYENYLHVWMHKIYPFYKFYFNSIKVVSLTILGSIFICSSAAYAFSMIKFKGKGLIFMLYMATLMVPHQVTLVPRFALFYWLNIYNSHLALILPGMFYVIGIFLLRQFYLSIPNELCESARLDGAGHLRTWLQIILPLTKTAMISLTILLFVICWNDYMNPLIFINNKDLYTIPLGMQLFLEEDLQQYNLIMAAATSSILPVIILFVALQKYFIQGIVTSGLKG